MEKGVSRETCSASAGACNPAAGSSWLARPAIDFGSVSLHQEHNGKGVHREPGRHGEGAVVQSGEPGRGWPLPKLSNELAALRPSAAAPSTTRGSAGSLSRSGEGQACADQCSVVARAAGPSRDIGLDLNLSVCRQPAPIQRKRAQWLSRVAPGSSFVSPPIGATRDGRPRTRHRSLCRTKWPYGFDAIRW
jgi:hypothetical protein